MFIYVIYLFDFIYLFLKKIKNYLFCQYFKFNNIFGDTVNNYYTYKRQTTVKYKFKTRPNVLLYLTEKLKILQGKKIEKDKKSLSFGRIFGIVNNKILAFDYTPEFAITKEQP